MEKKLMDLLKVITEGALEHPGKGAHRAIAVIGALGAKEEIRWNDVTEFEVGWVMIDGEIFPEIKLKFQEGPKYPPSPWGKDDFPGHDKVLVHDDKDGNTHLREKPGELTESTGTICGVHLNPISTTGAGKMPVTCTKCLEKVCVL